MIKKIPSISVHLTTRLPPIRNIGISIDDRLENRLVAEEHRRVPPPRFDVEDAPSLPIQGGFNEIRVRQNNNERYYY